MLFIWASLAEGLGVKDLVLKGAGKSLEEPHWHGGQSEKRKLCSPTERVQIRLDVMAALSVPEKFLRRIPPGAIERREVDRIQELSHRFLGFVSDARERLAPQKDSSTTIKTDFRKLHKQTVTR